MVGIAVYFPCLLLIWCAGLLVLFFLVISIHFDILSGVVAANTNLITISFVSSLFIDKHRHFELFQVLSVGEKV